MSDIDVAAPYTLRSVEDMLGLSRAVLTGLIEAAFVSPVRGPRNEYRFSFQDVVVLRTAHQLRSAKLSQRRMVDALRSLRSKLPSEMPASGLRIKAIGKELAVRTADANWETPSGQLLIDFEVTVRGGTVVFLPAAAPATSTAMPSAADAYREAVELEATDLDGAEAGYRQALELDPSHVDAAVNLGALLCERGKCAQALAVFDASIALNLNAALLHFNRAIALEDLGREAEALSGYRRSLVCDPTLADAHFNAARLLEASQDVQGALRHYNAYRRLRT